MQARSCTRQDLWIGPGLCPPAATAGAPGELEGPREPAAAADGLPPPDQVAKGPPPVEAELGDREEAVATGQPEAEPPAVAGLAVALPPELQTPLRRPGSGPSRLLSPVRWPSPERPERTRSPPPAAPPPAPRSLGDRRPGRLEPGPPRVPRGSASWEDKVARFRALHAIYHGLRPKDLTDLAARRARPALGCQARRAVSQCGF